MSATSPAAPARLTNNPPPYLVLSCKCAIPLDKTICSDTAKDTNIDSLSNSKKSPLKENAAANFSDPTKIWEMEIRHQLKRRGFLVEDCFHDSDNTHAFLLTIAKKRYQMLDAERENKGFFALSGADRFRLAQDSMSILKRLVTINFGIISTSDGYLGRNKHKLNCHWNIWIAHDATEFKKVRMASASSIKDYFGNKIAMYFAFLKYYTNCLFLLAIFGALVFAHEVTRRSFVGSVCIPYV
jgi:hypothetical protein